jgi:hypothetical protein
MPEDKSNQIDLSGDGGVLKEILQEGVGDEFPGQVSVGIPGT